jgi:UDP-N-acetylmuramoyl-tripeptide--D-alanyl-D-alanine ligase
VIDSRTIRDALGLEPSSEPAGRYVGISTDSREIGRGELFVALRGERHDAADYLAQVAARGARGAIVTVGREDPELPLEYFGVPDPLAALGALASAVRRASTARVVGITGSSGKTTVKEMVALALAEGGRVHRTAGNQNSQVGLPLTILRAPPAADFWVLEIGASELGEIARLSEIAAPDDGLITTVGPAHLEAFGDEAGVLAEKLDLARRTSREGLLVVGELPPALAEAARSIRPDAVVAGRGAGADYRPDTSRVEADRVEFVRGDVRVEVPVGGEHHLRDALLAAAMAEGLGVPLPDIARGLAGYHPLGLRGAVRQVGGLTVIADCYNANPESFRAAIAQCRDLYPGRRLAAFVGSMLELGGHEAKAHDDIARLLASSGFALVAATGAFARRELRAADTNGTRFIVAEEPDDAWDRFAGDLRGDEVVLVKASRGAHLERVLDRIDREFGEPG